MCTWVRDVIMAVETEIPTEPANIAEHREQRGRVALQPLRNGLIGEHAQRHEQEADPSDCPMRMHTRCVKSMSGAIWREKSRRSRAP